MFENKTYDNIMEEMLSNISSDVRTDEGSLIYNALCKQALQLEEAYMNLSFLYDNILPTTMSFENLKIYGEERGVIFKEAEYCYIRCVATHKSVDKECVIEKGMTFYTGDYVFEVTEKVDENYYILKCTEPGASANSVKVGTNLTPIDWAENLDTLFVESIYYAGKDAETEEHYRQRVIDSFNPRAFSGNRTAYVEKIKQHLGVGGVKAFRRNEKTGYIDIYVQAADYDVPSNDLVSSIQEEIDPKQDGNGDGFCPICHKVQIHPVDIGNLDIRFSIEVEEDFDKETTKNNAAESVKSYIKAQNKKWDSSEHVYIQLANLASYVLNTPGVKRLPLGSLFINNQQNDLYIGSESAIAKIKTLTISTL